MSCGISTSFEMLFHARGQITHVLLTRLPRYRGLPPFASDLHVLGTPPAFVLSQDQTLQLIVESDGWGRRFANWKAVRPMADGLGAAVALARSGGPIQKPLR